jgi:hypothetical protein
VHHKTVSETAFEQFCITKRISWEPIPTEDATGSKTPDYFIFPSGVEVAAEVKEVTPNSSEREQLRQFKETGWSTFGGTVGDRARSLISTAAKQLRPKAKGRCPALIVIYNPDFMLRQPTEPHQIKAAMYGFDTIVLGLSSDMTQRPSLIDRKSGPGRMMTDQHNTTVSAVAVFDDTGLTLYHNLFAAIPLDSKTFKGIAVRQFKLGGKQPGEFVEWVELE